MFAECCSCPVENREVTAINYKMISDSASNSPQDCPQSEATETDDEVSEKGSCHEFPMFSRRECSLLSLPLLLSLVLVDTTATTELLRWDHINSLESR